MSSQFPPLTCKQVKKILKNLGFELEKTKRAGTSHEHWKKVVAGKLYKVTVDCPKEPFTGDLIRSMSHQAGVSKKKFYAALGKR